MQDSKPLFIFAWCACSYTYSKLNDSHDSHDSHESESGVRVVTITVNHDMMLKCDMLSLIYAELVEVFDIDKREISIMKANKTNETNATNATNKTNAITFMFDSNNHCEFIDFSRSLMDQLRQCMDTTWIPLLREKDNLQSIVLNLLRKRADFKLYASLHYSERYGAAATMDVLQLFSL